MGLLWKELLRQEEVSGNYGVRFDDHGELQIVFSALANVLPGEHLIVFAPARWPDDELGTLKETPRDTNARPLSAREREVLSLIADGLTIAEAAQQLSISAATVRTHVTNTYRKLGARNRPTPLPWR